MRLMRIGLVVVFVGVAVFMARSAHAQRRERYQPRTPTLSPYLNLSRQDSAPMGNYHTFVRPRLQLQDQLRRQQHTLQRQGAYIQQLGQEVSQTQQSGLLPATGTASVFMDYSHYFPALRSADGSSPMAGPMTSVRRRW